MIFSRNSLKVRIVLPIFAIFTVTVAALVFVLFSASHNVSKKSYAYLTRQQGDEVRRILDTAVSDLVTARLMDNRMVMEAKQRVSLDEIASYLRSRDLRGVVLGPDGSILYASVDAGLLDRVKPFLDAGGPFHFESGFQHYNGVAFSFPAWGWRVLILHRPVTWLIEAYRSEFGFLMPSAALLGLALFCFTLLIIRRNFQNPVERILADLAVNREIGPTGIDELDTIGSAINVSFEGLRSKAAELNRFKQEIDSAFDLIMMADESGAITYINPACERVTGYSVAELIGRNAGILMHAEAGVKPPESIWAIVRGGGVWRGEFSNVRKNGETYHTSAVIFPLQGTGGMNIGIIQRDISQEKKLYEQLLRSQKLEALGTLAGGIAHDFNNILTAILGYAELLAEMPGDPENTGRYARTILNAAEQGAELTRRILSTTRKDRMQIGPVDLNGVARTALSLLERSIPKNIEVVARLDESIPGVLGDRSQLQQVIVNLSVNARDAMPDGGRLVISTERSDGEELPHDGQSVPPDGYVRLCISDTGHGMDAETRLKVFDPFFTTKETGKGTGLGLFIVHTVVANHGGTVNIYSEPGRGTRFSIYLPATRETALPDPDDAGEILGRGTILVIDDEPDILDLCKDLLASLGYDVITAGSGADGIALYDENRERISLVLLDMIMPKMGGDAVYRALKADSPGVRVLLSSGYTPDGYEGIDVLIAEGAAGFVSKPFSRKGIGRAIRKALSKPPDPASRGL